MSLTRQARRRYLRTHGVRCPYCRSDQIEGGAIDVDCGQAIQPVTCLSCGKRWRDIYVLNDIEGLQDDTPDAQAPL